MQNNARFDAILKRTACEMTACAPIAVTVSRRKARTFSVNSTKQSDQRQFGLPGMVAVLRLIALDTQQRGANLLGRVLFLAQVDEHLDVLERIVRQAAALVLERRDGRWRKMGHEVGEWRMDREAKERQCRTS